MKAFPTEDVGKDIATWTCDTMNYRHSVLWDLKRDVFTYRLKCSGLGTQELIQFYRTCIHPLPEYASPVFHDSLPKYLSEELERIQRRAMRIIFPFKPHQEALALASLETLSARRQSLMNKSFSKITEDRNNNVLLPERNNCHYNLRKKRKFNANFQTNRLKNSFLLSNALKL